MKTNSNRGDGGITVIIILAALALGFMAPKPKFLDARSREADKSVVASKEVEKAVADALAAQKAKGGTISASLAQIGVAAGQLPDSPQKSFIVREGVWLSPLLDPPDPVAMRKSYERRIATLEGKIELADKLYAAATKDNAGLIARAAKSDAQRDAAFAARRDMDTKLVESAAEARGKDQVIGVLVGLFLLALVGWVYVKFTSLPKIDIARMANRAREEGANALDVIDAVVPDSWHPTISKIAADLRAKEAASKAAAVAKAAA